MLWMNCAIFVRISSKRNVTTMLQAYETLRRTVLVF